MKKFNFVPSKLNLFAAFLSDAYKPGHGPMYSDGTNIVYNNLTPRSDKIYRRACTRYYDGKLVFVGAQGAIMETVANWNVFFAMPKDAAVAMYKELVDNVLGKDVLPTEQLGKLHDIGYLPLEIKTLDEGDKIPMGIPVMTIKNTVDHAYWLVNFLETSISNLTWKGSTNATTAAEYKAMLTDYAMRTGTPIELINWQAHSFADRGMSGPEDAARSGMGHSALFLGSDSLGTIMYAQQYYFAGKFVSGSVPATEHAVATSNILRIERALDNNVYSFKSKRQERIACEMLNAGEELRLIAEMMFLYELMLKFPTGILSYVTDSFDFWGVLTKGLPYMKEVIMARDGKLVIRPDSGDPVEVVCGVPIHDMTEHSTQDIISKEYDASDSLGDVAYQYRTKEEESFYVRSKEGDILKVDVLNEFYRYYNEWNLSSYEAEVAELTAEEKGAVEVLHDLFGGTITETGYKMLDSHIGLIYGDSITTQRCLAILEGMESKGFASGNCVFGVGSFTYQCVTRDTFGFAVKATYTEVNGEPINIFKDPKTDSKKKSAKGLLCVVPSEVNGLALVDEVSKEVEQSAYNLLQTRFKDGEFYNLTTLDIIRSKL